MANASTIIIGAGAAGLMAAKVLSDAGQSVVVIEARDRIGGRILTHHDAELGIPLELGAEFVHGRPDITWKLIREARLRVVDLPFDHRRLSRGRLSAIDDVNDELGEVMSGLSHLGPRDLSFSEYLRRHRGGTAAARRFAVHFVQGFDAADPQRISAQSLAEEQEGIGDVDNETQFRMVDGYSSLIDYLHKSLNPKRVTLHLGAPVSAIHWQKSKVQIELVASGRGSAKAVTAPRTLHASRAIVTLPVGVLQMPPEAAGSLRFVPDIPDKREAAMQLASGPIVKAVLRFRAAFWEDPSIAKAARTDEKLRDAVFMHAPNAPFPTWWTLRPLRVPVLTAWAGGPKAVALAGLSKRELTEAAIRSLAMLLNQRPQRLHAMLEQVHTHDWASDPFSRGAYSYVTVGGMHARAMLARPIKNTLFFAGEATDTFGQTSTVAGALASGERAAREVLKRS